MRQHFPLANGQTVWICIEYLKGYVVGASVQMLHHASLDRVNVSPRHDGVHQAVTSTAREIIVGEP